ncbi:hypothetical protein PanWU01x14_259620 [Parasponia andersonii]|uniref:Uncharacterized protein n=1 Tax=Parasponia andersonii TaxID=3476 RepID=A0A2P5B9A2_PARAD|nr:hypothetical protein PanWU01x14_259620 [Parasponia andersonii]
MASRVDSSSGHSHQTPAGHVGWVQPRVGVVGVVLCSFLVGAASGVAASGSGRGAGQIGAAGILGKSAVNSSAEYWLSSVSGDETAEGDIFDCVGFNKQRPLNHPLQKNHKIQVLVFFPSPIL